MKHTLLLFSLISILLIPQGAYAECPPWAEPEVNTIIVVVEKPVNVFQSNRLFWDDVKELRDFLKQDKSDSYTIAPASAGFEGLCHYRALELSQNAESVGKRLELIRVSRAEYYKWFGVWIPQGNGHRLCGAVMDNGDYYFIEPQTDEIKWVSYVP